jgi:hypothetical protein
MHPVCRLFAASVAIVIKGPSFIFMAQHNCRILNWNVRGLNDGARRDSVNELVCDTGSAVVCLQETKLQVIDDGVVIRRTFGTIYQVILRTYWRY